MCVPLPTSLHYYLKYNVIIYNNYVPLVDMLHFNIGEDEMVIMRPTMNLPKRFKKLGEWILFLKFANVLKFAVSLTVPAIVLKFTVSSTVPGVEYYVQLCVSSIRL